MVEHSYGISVWKRKFGCSDEREETWQKTWGESPLQSCSRILLVVCRWLLFFWRRSRRHTIMVVGYSNRRKPLIVCLNAWMQTCCCCALIPNWSCFLGLGLKLPISWEFQRLSVPIAISNTSSMLSSVCSSGSFLASLHKPTSYWVMNFWSYRQFNFKWWPH